jgi:hypothetical protein
MIPIPASDKPLVDTPLLHWHVAIIALVGALLAFATLLTWRHEGSWRGPQRIVEGSTLQMVLGGGAPVTGKGFQFQPQTGATTSAVASTQRDFAPIEARDWAGVRLHWTGGPATLLFGWLDPDGRQRVISVANNESSPAFIDLLREPEWRGAIRGLTFLVRGDMAAPLTLVRIELVGGSAMETARRMVAEWTTFESWHGGSINYVYGGHSSLASPMPVFAALMAVYSMLLFLAFTRGWAKIGNGWQLAALLMIPWLLLDIRWVTNLGRQLETTAQLFAGKTAVERRRVDDADFFSFIERAKAQVPNGARVYMFADDEYHRVKGGYLLRPLNSLNIAKEPSLLPPDTFRPGEYLVLFKKRNVRYSRREAMLRYGDNAAVPAELIDLDRGNGLFRVLSEEERRAKTANVTPGSAQP